MSIRVHPCSTFSLPSSESRYLHRSYESIFEKRGIRMEEIGNGCRTPDVLHLPVFPEITYEPVAEGVAHPDLKDIARLSERWGWE